MAEVFDALGKPERAQANCAPRPPPYSQRFNEVFWDEELGFYAYALDGDKNKVLTIASNAGHCLWSGIVPAERAKRVVDRLMAPDMWTGWGIRTLSADHAAFNPYNYQTGSVWPHDNAIIAMGFKRYGFHPRRRGSPMTSASQRQVTSSLINCRSSTPHPSANKSNFPVQYIGANVPQAWAAGSVFMLTQALLGFLRMRRTTNSTSTHIFLTWLPDLTIYDLRIGKHMLDIRFWREGEQTAFDVIKGDRKLVEHRDVASMGTGLRTTLRVG